MGDDFSIPGNRKISGKRRHDKPGEQPADDPVRLPGPAFDLLVRNIKTAGGEATDEMENNTQKSLHEYFLDFIM
ncbi:hypothetical protein D3C86_2109810 [compost metagenome]